MYSSVFSLKIKKQSKWNKTTTSNHRTLYCKVSYNNNNNNNYYYYYY